METYTFIEDESYKKLRKKLNQTKRGLKMSNFKLTEAQNKTIDDEDNEVIGIVSVSGSTVVIGKTDSNLGFDSSIFMHTDDADEPLYMDLQEARILSALLTVAVG